MVKEKDELRELIDLLKKLLSRKARYSSRKKYRLVSNFYPVFRPPVFRSYGNYRFFNRYSVNRGSGSYNPKLRYGSDSGKSGSYVSKPWSEPMPYKPRERLVYDPEVKQLLERIERHLAGSKQEKLENVLELKDTSDRVEGEDVFEGELAENDEDMGPEKGDKEVDGEATEFLEEIKDVESSRVEGVFDFSSGEFESLSEVANDVANDVEVSEGFDFSSNELEVAHNFSEFKEGFEALPSGSEVFQGSIEPDVDVIEKLDDLSSLEAKLFQPEIFRDLEAEVEDVEEGEVA